MTSLAFEYLAMALESTRGTAITNPTVYFNMSGMINPKMDRYRPVESRGTLAEFYRSKVVRKFAEWEGEGPLDVNSIVYLLNMAVKAVTTPATPGGGTNSRLWTFTPTMTSDDVKSATLFWGDPNTQILRSVYAMIGELKISSDASGTDGATMSVNGTALFPTQVADPVVPAQVNGALVTGGEMEVWIDTASAIGTTAITGRVVSAEHTISSGVTYKYLAQGPSSTLGFTRTGRGKRHIETRVVMELLDMAQYDLWAAATVAKMRVRHNGPLIEGALYNFVEVDTYGPLDALSWGDLEGSNRTVEFTIQSEYDTTLGADFSVKVQNTLTALA